MTSHLSLADLDISEEDVVTQGGDTAETATATINSLPNELLMQIAEYLNSRHRMSLWTVNQQFHTIAQKLSQQKIKMYIDAYGIRSSFPLDKINDSFPVEELTIYLRKTPTLSDHGGCTRCENERNTNSRVRCLNLMGQTRRKDRMEYVKESARQLFSLRQIKSVRTCRVNHGRQYAMWEGFATGVRDLIGDLPFETLIEVTTYHTRDTVNRFMVTCKGSDEGEIKCYYADPFAAQKFMVRHRDCASLKGYEDQRQMCAAATESASMCPCIHEALQATGAGQALLAFNNDIIETKIEHDTEDGEVWGRPARLYTRVCAPDEDDWEHERLFRYKSVLTSLEFVRNANKQLEALEEREEAHWRGY